MFTMEEKYSDNYVGGKVDPKPNLSSALKFFLCLIRPHLNWNLHNKIPPLVFHMEDILFHRHTSTTY